MEISIDTSTRYASIVLSDNGTIQAELSWYSQQNHTVELAPSIAEMMWGNKSKLDDLKSVFVAKGPGGFSALRVGMSFAKGLAESLGAPLIGVSTLHAEAFPYLTHDSPVCPMVMVGRNQFAYCLFELMEGSWDIVVPESILSVEEIFTSMPEGTVFCGEGVLNITDQGFGPEQFQDKTVQPWNSNVRASSVLAIGWDEYLSGSGSQIHPLEPTYLRQPTIGRPSLIIPPGGDSIA